MLPRIKKMLLPWTPPAVLNWYGGYRPLYEGDYASWDAAAAAAGGYDQPSIFERVRQSAAKVRDGQAAYERDGVTFDHIEHAPGLLASLLRIAALDDGRLNVLDFGGALGSSYRQCENFIRPAVNSLAWNIVEQPQFVKTGQAEFTTNELKFYETIDACLKEQQVNVVLLSGVLPYLPQPHAMLDDLLARKLRHVILDRMPFVHDIGRDVLTVQRVPAEVYGHELHYPAWFFDPTKMHAHFEKQYELVMACASTTANFQIAQGRVEELTQLYSLRR